VIDNTISWDGHQHFRILDGTPMGGWTCPCCGDPLALDGAMKTPRQPRMRVRLTCSRQACQGVDLVVRVTDSTLYARLAGVRLRNVVMPAPVPVVAANDEPALGLPRLIRGACSALPDRREQRGESGGPP
jgi:hypothetical protein